MTDRPTPGNWASVIALGVIWGGTFMFVSLALRGHGPLTVAAARTALGAVALVPLMLAFGRRLPRGARAWAYAAPIGVLNTALPFFLLSWGLQYVPSAFGGLSMATLPLMVMPLAHLFSDEPMSWRGASGVGLGFAGALVLLGPGIAGFATGPLQALGQIACIGAAFSYAIASILTRKAPRIDAITLSFMTLAMGAVVLVPAALIVEGLPRPTGALPDAAILFLGLVPTALAALIRTRVIQTAGSVFMTLTNYQVPLWSVLFGAALLGEDLPVTFFAALVLILSGLALGQARALRALFGGRAARPRLTPKPPSTPR
ncbi:DMT family transporter [Palleronia sediminis]|uniref:DMT family transporter n=1 Tax=Palleronia sediminis TaxID=2547833 RepID=A0A4R6AEV3_9RHOB|nr:DMT family transporter [Palleronia sediminis]TDL79793.1 DMT family transporter [Palleronia sediminis]